ncbi:Ac92-like protein [Homarus gammarus nudivirus]|uniref:Sulfhydryl oxidase n=1 Tax=Homarus gammarus nudivirus TaxID=2509616 RepID=A0A411HB38_9VIRU|nr:Ac92-like protein [Homarus gammarus nudivirus]QBB28609.1 Ac92-like protein [Homarus gammarus nudivirus]
MLDIYETTSEQNIYITNNELETLEDFKGAVSAAFAYMKQLKPKQSIPKCGKHLTDYQYRWTMLIISLLEIHGHKTEANGNMEYLELMDALHIKPTTIDKDAGYFKNVWGPIYWRFLHLTSILCRTKYQKDLFATNMLNFNLCIICPECASNFKKKEPFIIMMIMSLSEDVVTPIYNLHNIVNDSLHRQQYSFEDFLTLYNIQVTDTKINTYRFIY